MLHCLPSNLLIESVVKILDFDALAFVFRCSLSFYLLLYIKSFFYVFRILTSLVFISKNNYAIYTRDG